MGIQLLLHKTIKHFLREQRLLVAKGFADEDQGHYGLTTGVQPEGIQGVQRLLGGLVQGEMQQKAAVLFPAALVHELVGVPVLVQPVEALVQRQVGAELRKAGGAGCGGYSRAGTKEKRSRQVRRQAGQWKLRRS